MGNGKIMELVTEHGMEGYGIYWMLMEQSLPTGKRKKQPENHQTPLQKDGGFHAETE